MSLFQCAICEKPADSRINLCSFTCDNFSDKTSLRDFLLYWVQFFSLVFIIGSILTSLSLSIYYLNIIFS